MPISLAGGGKKPSRPSSHKPLEMDRLIRLATELEETLESSGEPKLNATIIDELAADLGVPAAHLYVAAATMSELEFDTSSPVLLEVCAGGCQAWGAVDLIERAHDLFVTRSESDQTTFGIVPRKCLDKCERAAVVQIRTPDGTAGLSETTLGQIDEAVAQALD